MNRIVVGVDIAKRVFQLHWVEPETGEIVMLQLKREKFLEHFANRSSCVIGMEACGGSQHWARTLQKLGHEVKLLSGRMVKPFVGGNKNDVADARGIWTAVQQPGIKAVAVKSEAQQAVLALHRMREQPRSVLTHSKSPPEWLTELVKRRPKNVAVVAMANKMARTIWALTAHERAYQSGYVSRPA